MDNIFGSTVMADLPTVLSGRVFLQEGILHISSELKGNMELDDLVGRLQHRGRIRLEWHSPKDFDRNFGTILSGDAEQAGNPMQQYAVDLIKKAHTLGASDIHITDYGRYTLIALRRLGMVQDFTQLGPRDGSQLIQCIYQTLSQSADACFSPTERQDGRIARAEYLPKGVFSVRLHTEPIQSTLAADGTGTFLAMRLLFDATAASGTLQERTASLGFTRQQQELLHGFTERTGLVIISGPTGHGKSTLLKHCMESMVDEVPEKNYMSIEDPPEFPLKGIKQILVSTKILTEDQERERKYDEAIAGGMRSDLDTLMIGEIRYREAAHAAIAAALTGHGVWSTVHASNALAIIPRLTEMGIPLTSLCNQNVLAGLTYQRLLPLLCPHCKEPLLSNKNAIPQAVFERLIKVVDDLANVYVRGQGCEHCDHMGLVGQAVAAEVIAMDQTLLNFLRKDDLFGAHAYWIKELHGMTHVAHALKRIAEGQVDPHNAEIRMGVPLDFDLMRVAAI